jgi:hypothetical protein
MKRIDFIGNRYGRLIVLSYKGTDKHGARLWECLCDCGNFKTTTSSALSRGDTRSCGCLFKEMCLTTSTNKKPLGVSAFNQLYSSYKRSAKARGYNFELTKEHFRELTQSNCYYCHTPPSQDAHIQATTNGGYVYTGIDRIDNNFGYIAGNVRPCCKSCNISKGTLTEQEFYTWVLHVLAHSLEAKAGA